MPTARRPRVALVHDYLTQYGGAEKVLEALHELWPSAQVFTTFYEPQTMARLGFRVPARLIRPLLPSALPRRGRLGKLYTPLYPALFRRLDLRGYDLVISSTSFAAHQVQPSPGALHISYCHSPPRFLYGLTTELDHRRLRRRIPGITQLYDLLRALDRQAARRVNAIAANSEEVRRRISRCYGREATVIHPPVDVGAFAATPPPSGDYFLAYGRLVGSKRTDLIVEAAGRTGLPVVVAGDGPERAGLRRLAGQSVRFTGRPDHQTLLRLLARCRAVIVAAEEDFGMVPVEAMAAGKPVIAYGAGGVLESVVAGVTGEFFYPQTAGALQAVLTRFNPRDYDPAACRARAALFDGATFARRFGELVAQVQSGAGAQL